MKRSDRGSLRYTRRRAEKSLIKRAGCTQAWLKALRRKRLPVVDVSAALAEPVFPRVMTDGVAATRLAFEHLRERGFEGFAYCGDPRFHWARPSASPAGNQRMWWR